jgi:hypothetical protein
MGSIDLLDTEDPAVADPVYRKALRGSFLVMATFACGQEPCASCRKPTKVPSRGCATLSSRHSQPQAHFWEQHYELQETNRIKQELLRSLLLFV